MATKLSATIEDLAHVPDKGKAELVNDELVAIMPTGGVPGYAGGEIFASLRDFARRTRMGYAFPDNVGFLVQLPNRRSLSPDAAFYQGTMQGGQFLIGPPVFAAEVRSENDYGAVAEQQLADKRADYFAAGTEVVWDVDVLRSAEVRKYLSDDPDNPIVFQRGDFADAEPALSGWRFAVDDLFP